MGFPPLPVLQQRLLTQAQSSSLSALRIVMSESLGTWLNQ